LPRRSLAARTTMKKRHLYSIILPIIYIATTVFSLFNSELGHAGFTGTAFFFAIIISFPLGLIPFGLAALTGNDGLIFLFPVFGILQYAWIGYFYGRWQDRRQTPLR
jgi:hypothetical protein